MNLYEIFWGKSQKESLTLGKFPMIIHNYPLWASFSKTNKTRIRNTEWDSITRCSCSNTGKINVDIHRVLKMCSKFFKVSTTIRSMGSMTSQRPGSLLCWECLKLCFNSEHHKEAKLWTCEVRRVWVQSLTLSFILGGSDSEVVIWLLQASLSLPEKLNWKR